MRRQVSPTAAKFVANGFAIATSIAFVLLVEAATKVLYLSITYTTVAIAVIVPWSLYSWQRDLGRSWAGWFSQFIASTILALLFAWLDCKNGLTFKAWTVSCDLYEGNFSLLLTLIALGYSAVALGGSVRSALID